MALKRVLRGCRVIFYLSTAALCIGFLLVLPLLLGGNWWLGTPAVTEMVGSGMMGVGAVTGGVSGLLLLTS